MFRRFASCPLIYPPCRFFRPYGLVEKIDILSALGGLACHGDS